jgi:hypothetical protein
MYYTYYYFNPLLLNNGEIINLDNKTRADISQLTIGTNELDDPKSIRYFYDGWFRINSSDDFGKTYVLFNRGSDFIVTLTGHKLSVMYSYDPSGTDRSVAVTAGQGVDPSTGILHPASGGKKHTTIMDIATHFPFQKWVYLCINVDENTMDAYLNGKLVKSVSNVVDPNDSNKKIRFSDAPKTKPITIGNIGVKGKIARFRRESGLLDPQSVWNIYIQGPGVTDEDDNGTGDYHAKLLITRDNRTRRKFNIY